MQKNAFHEICTLLSRTFLRGRHAGGHGKVQGLPFCVYNKDTQEEHIPKKKEWIDVIGGNYEKKDVFLLKLTGASVYLFCDGEHRCHHIESF